MPKRSAKSPRLRPVLLLAAFTLALFVAGEALILGRSDAGQIAVARYLHWGDQARVTRLIGIQIRRGLETAGVPRDSLTERVVQDHPAVRWRVGLAPETSLIQANYAVTRQVEEQGAEVLAGREHPGTDGASSVTLTIGFPGRPTHEVVLAHVAPRDRDPATTAGRLALVLYGFGSEGEKTGEKADAFFQLGLPFAVALAPGAPASAALFRAARALDREVVLHLPLEPIHYPQIDPGPGTVLVTMKPNQIIAMVRRYLDQAGPVSAVANLSGSLATQDMAVMSAVYHELRRRRLPFLHMTPAAGAVCKDLAADLGVAYAEPNVVIDREAKQTSTRALDARWARVLEEARERGELLVMVRATPQTLKWLPEALAPRHLRGVRVVPVSAVLQRPAL